MEDCVFCKIICGEIPSHKIYEDEDIYAFLDINPVTKGHTLIIPKQHFENMLDTPKEIREKVMEVAKNLALKYKKLLKVDAFNFYNASGKEANQSVFHLHLHLIPRSENDGYKLGFKVNTKEKEKLEETRELLGQL